MINKQHLKNLLMIIVVILLLFGMHLCSYTICDYDAKIITKINQISVGDNLTDLYNLDESIDLHLLLTTDSISKYSVSHYGLSDEKTIEITVDKTSNKVISIDYSFRTNYVY